MKKVVITILLSAFAFAAQATVFTYENNGFNDRQGWRNVKSDLRLSYDDETDAFSFSLTQYRARHDYDFIRLVTSSGGRPTANDPEIWMNWYGNHWTSGYRQGNWLNINNVSSFDSTFGTNNTYSFSADLTDTLINAGNTTGLFGDQVGIWLWGGKHTRRGTRYFSIFDGKFFNTIASNVTEPAPLALLTIALAGLFFAKRRRNS